MTVEFNEVEVLLVEDNPGDVRLTMEALKEAKMHNRVSVVTDGIEAVEFLRKEGKYVAALSSDARLLLFEMTELPERPNGGVGVQLIALPENISLADVAVTDGKSLVVSGIRRKNRAVETLDAKQLAEHIGKRAQRGKLADVGLRPDRLDDSAR